MSCEYSSDLDVEALEQRLDVEQGTEAEPRLQDDDEALTYSQKPCGTRESRSRG